MDPDDNERNTSYLDEVIRRDPIAANPEIEAFSRQAELLKEIRSDVNEVRQRLEAAEASIESLRRKTKPLKKDWLYLAIFGVVALLTVALVSRGWAEKPTVSINYNVGEIIGGLLVGVAAVLAGVAYARDRAGNQ